MLPTRRTLLLAVAGTPFAALPLLAGSGWWAAWPIFVGWLVFGLGVDLILAPRPSSLTWALETPETIHVGRNGLARLKLDGNLRRAVPVEVRFDLSPELEPQPTLGGTWGTDGPPLELSLKTRRRGTARIERLWLRYPGPLGLMSRRRVIELGRELRVVPDTLPVHETALRMSRFQEHRIGLKIERFRGEGTEFDSLKEHGGGDDTRSIDWKHSARHRRLLSRQFRAERNHQVILAVDSGHLMSEPLDGIPKLDHAISAALHLAYVGLRTGDRVGLISFDARVGPSIDPQRGLGAHGQLTRLSGSIAYSDAETNFTLGLTTIAQRYRRRSLVVVLTDFVDTLTAELMLDNLDRLARRHLPIFVALRDPQIERIAFARPVDSYALNRAVVAQGFLRDRAVVLKRLRRLGILAIDAAPREIGPRLIESYLDVKRRERI